MRLPIIAAQAPRLFSPSTGFAAGSLPLSLAGADFSRQATGESNPRSAIVWRRAFIGSWLSEYIDDEKATPPRACASAFPLRGAHYAYAGRLWQTLRLANALMDFGIATNLSAEVALVKSNARTARMAANRAMSCDLCLAQHGSALGGRTFCRDFRGAALANTFVRNLRVHSTARHHRAGVDLVDCSGVRRACHCGS